MTWLQFLLCVDTNSFVLLIQIVFISPWSVQGFHLMIHKACTDQSFVYRWLQIYRTVYVICYIYTYGILLVLLTSVHKWKWEMKVAFPN